MDRFVLNDAQWAKMEPHCLGKPGDPGRSGKNNRLFVEAVLWVARTGSPWRDLPPSLGRPRAAHLNGETRSRVRRLPISGWKFWSAVAVFIPWRSFAALSILRPHLARARKAYPLPAFDRA
jgi:transposase